MHLGVAYGILQPTITIDREFAKRKKDDVFFFLSVLT